MIHDFPDVRDDLTNCINSRSLVTQKRKHSNADAPFISISRAAEQGKLFPNWKINSNDVMHACYQTKNTELARISRKQSESRQWIITSGKWKAVTAFTKRQRARSPEKGSASQRLGGRLEYLVQLPANSATIRGLLFAIHPRFDDRCQILQLI